MWKSGHVSIEIITECNKMMIEIRKEIGNIHRAAHFAFQGFKTRLSFFRILLSDDFFTSVYKEAPLVPFKVYILY